MNKNEPLGYHTRQQQKFQTRNTEPFGSLEQIVAHGVHVHCTMQMWVNTSNEKELRKTIEISDSPSNYHGGTILKGVATIQNRGTIIID